jgi:hypothetical protein
MVDPDPDTASAKEEEPVGGVQALKPTSRTDSCDEFPYASTAQGGKGAARKAVNKKENNSQGGNLVGFYNANRLF